MPLAGGVAFADADLRRVRTHVYKWREGSRSIPILGARIVADMVKRYRGMMTASIQTRVYDVPISPNYPVRSGRLLKGVRSREFKRGMAAGEIYISRDILGHNLYWYPQSVEFGLKRWPKYWGRYFFREGLAEVRAQFRKDVESYRSALKDLVD